MKENSYFQTLKKNNNNKSIDYAIYIYYIIFKKKL